MSDPEVPDAIKKLKDAVEKNPEDGQAYLELGNAWLKELNGTEALDAFQKATRLQPDCAEAYFGLAKSFDALQRYEEMLDAFKEACWLKPDWPEAHYNLGLVLLARNRVHEARHHAEIAYAAGFPLQGLRRKLEGLGEWPDSETP